MTENTKRKYLIAAIVLSIIPAVLAMKFPEHVTRSSVELYLSALLGYGGIVVLLWSYILGAKSVAGLVFKDLAPVLRIHKWLGKWGTLTIFVHPILIMLSYGEKLSYIFVPTTTTLFERHVTLGRLSFALVLIVWITSALLRSRIAFRPWRYIHLLGYIALPFAFLHVPDVGSQFMSVWAVKAYFMSLLLVFMVFGLMRLRGLLNFDKERYIVTAQQQAVADDPSVWIVKLRPVSGRIAPARGQYVYLKDGFISEEHPFSVLDYNEATGEILIAYRTFGRFTKEFAKRKTGDTVLLAGPYGEFTADIADTDKPIVFIAGGIGITPMLRHLFADDKREKWLFYANRTRVSTFMEDKLRKHLGSKLVSIVSRETIPRPGTYCGHINRDILERELRNPKGFEYYICGSEEMMQTTTKILLEMGIGKQSIHQEAFSW